MDSNVIQLRPAETTVEEPQASELLRWIDAQNAVLQYLFTRFYEERQEASNRGDAGAVANAAAVLDVIGRDLGWLQGMRTVQRLHDEGEIIANPTLRGMSEFPSYLDAYVRTSLSAITYRWVIAHDVARTGASCHTIAAAVKHV